MASPTVPSTEALDRMSLFNEKVNTLRRSTFAREMATESTGVTITWREGEAEPQAKTQGPQGEAVDAMILTLRLMEQDNDEVSLHRMAELYERLRRSSRHKTDFLEARVKINAYLDQTTEPSIVYKRQDPNSGKLVYEETLTNRRVLNLVIYGEKAHLNREKAAIVRSLRRWAAGSAMLDNAFNVAAAKFLDGLFYLQVKNAAFYEELAGKALSIDWPDPRPPPASSGKP